MTDLESRLTEALRRGAEGAPRPLGLAEGARVRARRRRRTTLGVVGAALVLAIGVPTAVVAWPEPRADAPDGPVAAEPIRAADTPADGYHWESWRTVTLQVPNTWGYGGLSTWCVSEAEPGNPVIERPGFGEAIACTPAQGYGVSFSERTPGADEIRWPVAAQSGGTWPEGAYVGVRSLGDVVVTVVARKSTIAQAVLDSVRTIDGRDANGCASIADTGKGRPEQGSMSVCRFDEAGDLVQSELLTGSDAVAAQAAIGAAASPADCDAAAADSRAGVSLTTSAGSVYVALDGCRTLTHGDRPTVGFALTSDVLYWALSPGFSGVTTGLPLPPVLRQE